MSSNILMEVVDVYFRKDIYWKNNESIITSLFSEFAEPANWDGEDFESVEAVIIYTKEYIAELMLNNCFRPIIRDDAVIVMEGKTVIEAYYGFTPVFKQLESTKEITIEKRTKENLIGKAPIDPFNTACYPHPDDFYNDYGDYFSDYEDAKKYWESHQENAEF